MGNNRIVENIVEHLKKNYYGDVQQFVKISDYLIDFINNLALSSIICPIKIVAEEAIKVPCDNSTLYVTNNNMFFCSEDKTIQMFCRFPLRKINPKGEVHTIYPEFIISMFTSEGLFIQKYNLKEFDSKNISFISIIKFFAKENFDYVVENHYDEKDYRNIYFEMGNPIFAIESLAEKKGIAPDAIIIEETSFHFIFDSIDKFFSSSSFQNAMHEYIRVINHSFVNPEEFLIKVKEKLSSQFDFVNNRTKILHQ